MKKILFVQPTITHKAGIDMAIAPIVKYLSNLKNSDLKNQYKVYTLSAYEKYNKENKSNIIDFDNGAINITMNENIDKISGSSFLKISKMFTRSIFIYKFIKKENIDFIIVSGDGLAISSLIISVLARRGVKFYAYIHENLNNISSINRFILRYSFRYFDKIICVSDGLCKSIKELMLNIKDNKVITIYNTFENSSRAEMNTFNLKYTNNTNIYSNVEEIIFLSVGRLEKVKGYECLIRAFGNFIETIKDSNNISSSYRLYIIGEGSERRNLELLILKLNLNSKVKLLGSMNHEEIYKVLEKAYIFINNSKYETFGVSLVEAMSVGVPVIINDCEYGPKEICKVNIQQDIDVCTHVFDYGVMCKEGDEKSLTEAMVLMATDKSMYKKFYIQKEINRSKDFSILNIIYKWLEIL